MLWIKETREKIDSLRAEADEAERSADFAKVAKIRYGDILTLEREIENIEKSLQELQENWKSFLKDKVTEEDIAEIIAKWTGIPASKLIEKEKDKLLKMEQYLSKQVVWQDKAINAVSNAIRRARAGLNEVNKPLGSFLFLWPTWVGKTETAKALAELLSMIKMQWLE